MSSRRRTVADLATKLRNTSKRRLKKSARLKGDSDSLAAHDARFTGVGRTEQFENSEGTVFEQNGSVPTASSVFALTLKLDHLRVLAKQSTNVRFSFEDGRVAAIECTPRNQIPNDPFGN